MTAVDSISSKKLRDINPKCEESKDNVIIEEIKDSTIKRLGFNEENVEAEVVFIKDYMTETEADVLYKALVNELDWQQREGISSFGGTYLEPRQTYWFGKPYKYSSVVWEENNNWNERLDNLRKSLSEDKNLLIDPQKPLNSVMCNFYRTGGDSIGWHADDETSLGRCPTIVSISLGATRFFDVCKREEYYSRQGKPMTCKNTFAGCTKMYRFHLNKGSLLLMKGSVQDKWLHRVPKADNRIEGRINLTFRHIVNDDEEKREIAHKRNQAKQRRLRIMRGLPLEIEPPHVQSLSEDRRSHDDNKKTEHKKKKHHKKENLSDTVSDEEKHKRLSKKRKKEKKLAKKTKKLQNTEDIGDSQRNSESGNQKTIMNQDDDEIVNKESNVDI